MSEPGLPDDWDEMTEGEKRSAYLEAAARPSSHMNSAEDMQSVADHAAAASVQQRFNDVNDFMYYTHDVLDMHRGLMIPGCIYCNGDM